ncbi:hypothetical protein BDR03DRAFT_651108 [Suillus americanus]|nr:hypothetical protein BDR03DRAFT_651108 [Suillus americanus]
MQITKLRASHQPWPFLSNFVVSCTHGATRARVFLISPLVYPGHDVNHETQARPLFYFPLLSSCTTPSVTLLRLQMVPFFVCGCNCCSQISDVLLMFSAL